MNTITKAEREAIIARAREILDRGTGTHTTERIIESDFAISADRARRAVGHAIRRKRNEEREQQ